jgi:hypothetical protein
MFAMQENAEANAKSGQPRLLAYNLTPWIGAENKPESIFPFRSMKRSRRNYMTSFSRTCPEFRNSQHVFRRHHAAFECAVALMLPSAERIAIPYNGAFDARLCVPCFR